MNMTAQSMAVAQTPFRGPRSQTIERPDLKTAAKQVETVFMNEMMRIMLEQTSLGQGKIISTFLPVITSEVSKSIAERGIGLGEFLFKNASGTELQEPGPAEKNQPSNVDTVQ